MSAWYRTYEVEDGIYVFAAGEPVGRFLAKPKGAGR